MTLPSEPGWAVENFLHFILARSFVFAKNIHYKTTLIEVIEYNQPFYDRKLAQKMGIEDVQRYKNFQEGRIYKKVKDVMANKQGLISLEAIEKSDLNFLYSFYENNYFDNHTLPHQLDSFIKKFKESVELWNFDSVSHRQKSHWQAIEKNIDKFYVFMVGERKRVLEIINSRLALPLMFLQCPSEENMDSVFEVTVTVAKNIKKLLGDPGLALFYHLYVWNRSFSKRDWARQRPVSLPVFLSWIVASVAQYHHKITTDKDHGIRHKGMVIASVPDTGEELSLLVSLFTGQFLVKSDLLARIVRVAQ